jgi:hypothetical protein
MVGYLGKELAKLPFKAITEHFSSGPVVISKGVKGLESLTKNRKPILTIS